MKFLKIIEGLLLIAYPPLHWSWTVSVSSSFAGACSDSDVLVSSSPLTRQQSFASGSPFYHSRTAQSEQLFVDMHDMHSNDVGQRDVFQAKVGFYISI